MPSAKRDKFAARGAFLASAPRIKLTKEGDVYDLVAQMTVATARLARAWAASASKHGFVAETSPLLSQKVLATLTCLIPLLLARKHDTALSAAVTATRVLAIGVDAVWRRERGWRPGATKKKGAWRCLPTRSRRSARSRRKT